MRMDETLAVFGVVKGPTALALARSLCGEKGQPSHSWRGCREGGRGRRLTQEGSINSLEVEPSLGRAAAYTAFWAAPSKAAPPSVSFWSAWSIGSDRLP